MDAAQVGHSIHGIHSAVARLLLEGIASKRLQRTCQHGAQQHRRLMSLTSSTALSLAALLARRLTGLAAHSLTSYIASTELM